MDYSKKAALGGIRITLSRGCRLDGNGIETSFAEADTGFIFS
jgi:hypothetical protein